MTVQDIAQFHRRAGAPPLPADAVLSLAAGVEHLVWRSTAPAGADSLSPCGPLWNVLRATGWPSASRPQDHGGVGTYLVPVREDLVFLRDIEMTLRGRIANVGFTALTAKALTGALSEIITNVWLHAQTSTPALVAYQLEQERVFLTVADLGIGVLQSLRSNPEHQALTTSMAALKKAMLVGVSRFPEQGRGYGFDTVLRAVADHGVVRLRTGEAVLEFQGTTDVRRSLVSYGTNLPGLQVALSCSIQQPPAPISL